MSQKLQSYYDSVNRFLHVYSNEVTGFFTGSTAGVITWGWFLELAVSGAVALFTGVMGAAGAYLFKKIVERKSKQK